MKAQAIHSLVAYSSFVRILVVFAAVSLISCGGPPDVYAPSVPRRPIDIYGTDVMTAWVAMNAKNAPVSIVRDVGLDVQAGAWRWASQHAELRFFLNSTAGWKAKVDYSVPRAILDEAGPLTLTFLVNNTPIDSVHHNQDGRFTWEKPVPAGILIAMGMNYIRIEADKSVREGGGHSVSFILNSAGFIR